MSGSRVIEKCHFLSWLLLPLLVATGAHAGTCPEADAAALSWLDKMSRSIHQVSYHGVVTLQRGDDMQVMQVSHRVDDGASADSLTQLTGQGAQVKRGIHPLECLHPGHQLLRISTEMRAGECGITRQYRLSVSDGERVAGRRSVRLSIEPRDMYRFGYIMALDKETGLLLKTEMLGHGDKTLEKFQFANLSYSEEVPGSTEVEVIHEARHPHPDNVVSGGNFVKRSWHVRWVPRGFTLTDTVAGTGKRRTYTDGLAVFSVFLEDLDTEIRPGEGLVRQGGTTTYTRGMRLSEQPVLVTVIGEIPVNTARMVADSVGWVQ
jgi:sigma-E factor negative regulatory protein RseB